MPSTIFAEETFKHPATVSAAWEFCFKGSPFEPNQTTLAFKLWVNFLNLKSPLFKTAKEFLSKFRTNLLFSLKTPSILPKNSVWVTKILVITPISGLANHR